MSEISRKKWRLFLKRIWPFSLIPFIDFVFASGSLATGKIHENSDFDVLIGVKENRIFTVRFFCFLIFSLLGWRRKKMSRDGDESDKICLNHFVTSKKYRLSSLKYNDYQKSLYANLVPILGDKKLIQEFWDANKDWMEYRKEYLADYRHYYAEKKFYQKFLEYFLSGKAGDILEKVFKRIQMGFSERSAKTEINPNSRIIFSDQELEFHPDPY